MEAETEVWVCVWVGGWERLFEMGVQWLGITIPEGAGVGAVHPSVGGVGGAAAPEHPGAGAGGAGVVILGWAR